MNARRENFAIAEFFDSLVLEESCMIWKVALEEASRKEESSHLLG
jgi:hypothetical protein